jgi:hypothetical protein
MGEWEEGGHVRPGVARPPQPQVGSSWPARKRVMFARYKGAERPAIVLDILLRMSGTLVASSLLRGCTITQSLQRSLAYAVAPTHGCP